MDFGEARPLEVQATRNGMQTWLDAPVKEAAVVYINDQRAGSLWCPPYRLDVSKLLKPGVNKIKIIVGNTALNFMSGQRPPDYKLLNTRYGERFQPQDIDKIQPIDAGLSGNIHLFFSGAK